MRIFIAFRLQFRQDETVKRRCIFNHLILCSTSTSGLFCFSDLASSEQLSQPRTNSTYAIGDFGLQIRDGKLAHACCHVEKVFGPGR